MHRATADASFKRGTLRRPVRSPLPAGSMLHLRLSCRRARPEAWERSWSPCAHARLLPNACLTWDGPPSVREGPSGRRRSGSVARAGRGDGSGDGTGGHEGDPVVEPVDRDAPRGAGEAPRSARDRQRLHDVEDIRRLRRRGTPDLGTDERVAVGRDELEGPRSGGRGHDVRHREGEPTQLARGPRRMQDDVGEAGGVGGPFEAAGEGDLLRCLGGAAERRRNQEGERDAHRGPVTLHGFSTPRLRNPGWTSPWARRPNVLADDVVARVS